MTSWGGGRIHFTEKKLAVNDEIVVCTFAIHEDKYIDEWIQYNLFLGFSHIFIYDNSRENTLHNKSSDKVTVIHFPGKVKEIDAFNEFAAKYKKNYQWAAFIACNEFIVLKKHDTILQCVRQYSEFSCIAINLKMFGTALKYEYENEPVTKRFQYCSNTMDTQVKCIAKLRNIESFKIPNYPELIGGFMCDTNKNLIESADFEGSDETICIHHYFSKSEQEFLERNKKAVKKGSIKDIGMGLHGKYNDIFNSDAWDFYLKHLECT